MPERRLEGIVAAPGLALGRARIERQPPAMAPVAAAGDVEAEAAALRQAVEKARIELEDLVAVSDGEAAAILAFQTALLEDEALLDPAYLAIAAGAPAVMAVRDAIAAQMAIYETDEDEYFRARAADLADVRDRLVRALTVDGLELAAADVEGTVLVADDLAPSHFLALFARGLKAALLARGSAASHVAMLARSRGLPLLVGLGAQLEAIGPGEELLVDGEAGSVVVAPEAGRLAGWAARLEAGERARDEEAGWRLRPALTRDGQRITVELNVDDPDLVERLDVATCDGIGLVRTEFLYQGAALPDEQRQLDLYARLLRWAAGRPVTIRTLDAGGDKPIVGVTADAERNPFLGLRGLRLCLARPDLFRVQLRALARAAALGPLEVMFPMVTMPEEIDAARALLGEALGALVAEGREARMPRLGMMVEVPAAALAADRFDVEFYSIGSNDLVQYTLAVARDEPAVADLYRPLHPAVLELIGRVIETGRRLDRPVTLCGDMAGDPLAIPALLDLGLERFSVAPAMLGRTKRGIAGRGAASAASDG
jgi:phosphotransferase system enzyme I (PtsI)